VVIKFVDILHFGNTCTYKTKEYLKYVGIVEQDGFTERIRTVLPVLSELMQTTCVIVYKNMFRICCGC
jgi:hypothetical protein